jgi:hypothetical protein
MRDRILRNGGTFIPPGSDSWGPHFYDLSVFDVQATGRTLPEAIRNWTKCVLTMEDALVGTEAVL